LVRTLVALGPAAAVFAAPGCAPRRIVGGVVTIAIAVEPGAYPFAGPLQEVARPLAAILPALASLVLRAMAAGKRSLVAVGRATLCAGTPEVLRITALRLAAPASSRLSPAFVAIAAGIAVIPRPAVGLGAAAGDARAAAVVP
jgi:hypothetical protein